MLLLCGHIALSQPIYYGVNATVGNSLTQAGITVTVSNPYGNAFRTPNTYPLFCYSNGEYEIAPVDGSLNRDSSALRFSFSSPVYTVRFLCRALDNRDASQGGPLGDSIYFKINGNRYVLTSGNLTFDDCVNSPVLNDTFGIDNRGGLTALNKGPIARTPRIDINSSTGISTLDICMPLYSSSTYNGSGVLFAFMYADTAVEIKQPYTDTSLCQGDSLYVHYFAYAPFRSGNVLNVELSNAGGGFGGTPNVIGSASVTAAGDGVVGCKIPATTTPSSTYRIRVVSTNAVRTSEDNGVSIRVKSSPVSVVAGGNALTCAGNALVLTATPGNSGTFSYGWTGPASYSSVAQNPSINPATTANSGDYIVTVTDPNTQCKAKDTFTATVVNLPATPTIGSNSPVCTGNSLDLTASSTTPGVGYEWTGPGGYSSLLQNPSISPAALSDAGVYTVKATASGCNSAAVSTTVVVNQTPATPAAGNNGPLCEGGKLILNANSTTPGTGYEWTGPDGFTSVAQNPVIEPVDMANEGTYTVKAVMNGCSSAEVTTDVDIVPGTPLGAYASPNDSICPGTYLTLVTVPPTTAPAQYQWFKNNNLLAGAVGQRYSTTLYADSDTFYVRMYSTSMCSTPVTLYSNKIGITEVNMPMPLSAKVKSTPSPALPGGAVSFDLDLLNEGQNPTFQWQKNGRDVANATFRIWSTSGLAPYDKVNCIVGSSDPCAEPKIKSSDTVEVNFATGVANMEGNDGVMLYPNPNDGSFRLKIQNAKLKSLEVVNVAGQVVYQNNLAVLQSELIIDLPANVAPGLYQLRLHTNKGNSIMKFTVVK